MAYTKTIADCEAYFYPNNHLQAYTWRKYDQDEKEAAFTQAKRELEVSLGRALVDPTNDDDTYQDAYAHYEQALYILENTPRQMKSGVAEVVDLTSGEKKKNIDRVGVLVSPQARRLFRFNPIKTARG